MRIAALITCHNRRRTTLACIEALFRQKLPSDTDVHVYLVDDGCTDGTADAVRQKFPQVRVIAGDGNLYWVGGMRLAWTHAFGVGYEYYLWLNDDCALLPGALAALLDTAGDPDDLDSATIAVGSTQDPVSGKTSYGGSLGGEVNRPLAPSDEVQDCDSMHGNVVLVPRVIANVVGNMSPEFTHCFADIDYGLRARRRGFHIKVTPHYAAECVANDRKFCWTDPEVPFMNRWREFHGPKGQPPYQVYIFARRHHGLTWPLAILRRYLRLLAPGPWSRLQQWRNLCRKRLA